MSSAADIARRAHAQALDAAEAARKQREAEQVERERQKAQAHQLTFKAALPILAEWFPGVKWRWEAMGDYGFDTILVDASEDWPPSFMLRAFRPASDRIEIEIGDYRVDTSMPGYSYFSGSVVRSAADVGRYLEVKAKQ
jgi:multidrug efflux pump subunit AcrA (membrane-fusion protein)